MENFKRLSALLCCSEYKNDEIIALISELSSEDENTALNSYSRLCELLILSGRTLSDYIFFLAVDKGEIIRKYLSNNTQYIFNTIKNDIGILSAFSKLSPHITVNYLKEKFGLSDYDFPAFETGDTIISTEVVISYVSLYGGSFFAENKAFRLEENKLVPVAHFDRVRLCDLKNYERQRKQVTDNTLSFINGLGRQNALLYGDRGTGKSSTVKAIVNEYPELRIIFVPKSSINSIYGIFGKISSVPLKFILFIDDISFGEADEGYSVLKQLLEGSVQVIPENCVIYATTNRRHIIKETSSERSGDELHAADARDENMSLYDRFGLYITFMTPDKACYLDIVKKIASDRKLDISEEKLFLLAERYALKKNGRSPRTAKQFVEILESRLELGLDINEI